MRLPRQTLGAVTATSPVVQQLAAAITRQEGSTQNNNPGNLVYVGQPGATGADSRGFAVFSTLAAGQAAEANQIALDINRGTCATGAPLLTEADLITCWAPPGANDTATYIANVSAWTGIDPNALLATAGATAVPADAGTLDTSDADLTGGIDLTDPTTLAVIGGLGLVAFLFFMR